MKKMIITSVMTMLSMATVLTAYAATPLPWPSDACSVGYPHNANKKSLLCGSNPNPIKVVFYNISGGKVPYYLSPSASDRDGTQSFEGQNKLPDYRMVCKDPYTLTQSSPKLWLLTFTQSRQDALNCTFNVKFGTADIFDAEKATPSNVKTTTCSGKGTTYYLYNALYGTPGKQAGEFSCSTNPPY